MEAVIFDCHYKKKWSSYWYCGEGNTCTLGESQSLEHTQHQLMPTIFGTDASRPPGISDITASSSVAPTFPKPLPFTSSGCKSRGRQPLPKPPLQSFLCKGMEQRCAGVGAITAFRKRSLMSQRKDGCLHNLYTLSVWGIAGRGQWSQ